MTQKKLPNIEEIGPFWAKWSVQDLIINRCIKLRVTPEIFYLQPHTANFYQGLANFIFLIIYPDFLPDNLNTDFGEKQLFRVVLYK